MAQNEDQGQIDRLVAMNARRMVQARDQIRLANAHREARDRALREVVGALGGIVQSIDAANYGNARDALVALRHDLTEVNGPSLIVERHLEVLLGAL